MFMPSIFGESLFDDFMDDFAFPDIEKKLYGKHAPHIMKTDVKDNGNTYEVDMDLPGFKKDEIQIQLKNGYVTVSAAKGLDKDEKDKEGKYVRRERYAGNVSRSFYVGDNVRNEEIHPKCENGILSFTVPKEQKAIEDTTHYIAIEG